MPTLAGWGVISNLDLDPAFDFMIPFHAMRRNLRYLQVEFRQDEVADAKGQAAWAQRVAQLLQPGKFGARRSTSIRS